MAAEEHSMLWYKEENEALQKRCAELQQDNERKDAEIARKDTEIAILKAALRRDGNDIDTMELLHMQRAEALDRYKREYENSNPMVIDSDNVLQNGDGQDEIDSLPYDIKPPTASTKL